MQGQTQFLDIYRSLARAAVDTMKTSLQSTERFHQQQLEMVRGALEQNAKSVQQLSELRNFDDLLALQSQIAGAQVAQTMDLWRTMLRAASDSQVTAMSQMQTQVSQATDTVRQAYDLTARATEDATRIAASQVTAVGSAAHREAQERRPEQERQQQQQRKSA
jgi:predicted restriction endonuclease